MKFSPTGISGSYIIDLEPFSDSRGWFARTYCKEEFQKIGHHQEWFQINHSFTNKAGTIRGMHFQISPYSEIKLLRCISGAIFDVIIDIRKDSPQFLQWYGIELSAQNRKMLYIPAGFAHGFQTITDSCELIYHHSEMYNKDAEAGIRYNDPAINIQWPVALTEISERDATHPLLDKQFKGI
jgi:dTDP-4-dehydrorhamnose 3,5-epimerase